MIPVLIDSLMLLVIENTAEFSSIVHALISTISVVVYFCCFKMDYPSILNILCFKIFQMRVRGLCIAICTLVFWIGNIIVTYTLPGDAQLNRTRRCLWHVPETNGMPLEVITEFFAVGARVGQPASAKNV
ncbi:hypothetical protein Ahy_A02g009775 [Arachis hypogaea]|uniref:Uncharacterized protein n=1 Tax=Arachis hypogaea TaxID=3818 RepID=A0A445EI35_ARAHY|nr:hypothetical protein Ahy_A02g009775 [Arachis hypogaea]